MFDRQVQQMFYEKAKAPADLPWHREEPDRFFVAALGKRKAPGRALDVGCGTGVFSVYTAKRGYQVTGLDLMARAIEMARARADAQGVTVDWVNADLFAWTPSHQYDLVLDSGCLHSLIGGNVRRYKDRLLQWLAPGGDYILGHWGKKHAFDWLPIGPRRRARPMLVSLFAPELPQLDYEQVLMTNIPFPFGPTVQGHCFPRSCADYAHSRTFPFGPTVQGHCFWFRRA